MNSFEQFNLPNPLNNAIDDLGFEKPTPMQTKAFSVIRSGKDIVGIAQTGTGKTLAYMLPLLVDLKFSKQLSPRIVVLVPTRELVLQVVEMIEGMTKYMNIRVLGVFGGKNISVQKQEVVKGTDILVATPGRLFDIAVSGVLKLKTVKKLVIDEVDVMMDAGFRPQLRNILDLLPEKRQHIMFSATMSNEVDQLIEEFFVSPERITVGISGTPLANIKQQSYAVHNFNTKVNLLSELLQDRAAFTKVLVFISGKKLANRLFEKLEDEFSSELGVIHGDKSQNFRIKAITDFEEGNIRILVATDVMARGLDFDKVSHVINFDCPDYPENYVHRIGRTGRAQESGNAILFYTEKEEDSKAAIEELMEFEIPVCDFPENVTINRELIPEEKPKTISGPSPHKIKTTEKGAAFHEKKDKNKKTNQGGSYLRKMKKYKKPKTRGDKNANRRKKK